MEKQDSSESKQRQRIPGKRVQYDLARISKNFEIPGTFKYGEPYGNGHINDTFVAHYTTDSGEKRVIHQRINHEIFKNPEMLMDNVIRVTEHQRRKLRESDSDDIERKALSFIPAKTGRFFHIDDNGNTWRTYWFVERCHSVEFVDSADIAYQAASSFGRFQCQLVDLPGGRLNETIPDFHNTPRRFDALCKVLNEDPVNRAAVARTEIDFALSCEGMTKILVDKKDRGEIPERVTHNDTKINNVLVDDETGKGVCVIDLDTVMPGLVLYDFGDMVRTSTSPSAEDEKDLSKVGMDLSLFGSLAKGYLETASGFLVPAEKEQLVFSGKLITFEIGIRFLADFLAGDKYFKTHRPEHNLDRCRTQFKLVQSIAAQEDKMQKIVDSLL